MSNETPAVAPRYPSPPPYYHGTRAQLKIGDLIGTGYRSNYGKRRQANNVYFSALLEPAVWGAELAVGEGLQRIYLVEPTGAWVDDPNLTDKRFPGNPTKSYCTKQPVRVVGEVKEWTPHSPEQIKTMHEHLARLKENGLRPYRRLRFCLTRRHEGHEAEFDPNPAPFDRFRQRDGGAADPTGDGHLAVILCNVSGADLNGHAMKLADLFAPSVGR